MYSEATAIRVEDLGKQYSLFARPRDRLLQMLFRGRRQYFRMLDAVRNVSFSVQKGEVVGIVGHNGSGKSTLLQMICGTLTPTSGQIEVEGRISALLELGAGFNPEFTGRENIFLNAALLGMSRQHIEEKLDEIIVFSGIPDFIDRPVKTYSSGMVVRLAFAVATAVDPDIFVVDEALAVGDEAFQRKCFDRIHQMKERGATILFVSHAANTVVELCDRALLMDHGELLLDGRPGEVMTQYHKLLFARDGEKSVVREAIRRQAEKGVAVVSASGSHEAPPAIAPDVNVNGVEPEHPEDYLPSMQSEQVVSYPGGGAEILNPRLLDMSGYRVNRLYRGRHYVFAYELRVETDQEGVRCGMMIRTAKGLELAGRTSATDRDGLMLKAGKLCRIRYTFLCRMNPGLYYFNAGSSALHEGERVFLHRLVDAVMSRVEVESDDLRQGLVDLEIDPDIEIV